MPNSFQLPRSTPETQGVSSTAINDFINSAERQKIELHSLMLLRHGHVVAEGWWSPYTPDRIHQLYSLSKSFTSTAIGIAVGEGLLSPEDLVLSFFPDKKSSNASEHLENMRVHHLLSMSTGHLEDAIERVRQAGGKDWVAGFFSVPPDQEPGTVFTYNNAATFMLSAILQNLTGLKLVDYLGPRLFAPLGITQAYWYENPQGINPGFSGLHITTEAIARFGQFYLQKGEWLGHQIISKEWVETATSKQIPTNPPPEDETPDWEQGYGYQFWQSRNHTYRADGAFGQFCLVMPEQEAILAITAGCGNMQSILDLVWKHLLPAMDGTALGEDGTAQIQLSEQLDQLAIQPVHAQKRTPMTDDVSGKRYDFRSDQNAGELEYLTLDFYDEHVILTAQEGAVMHQVHCGYHQWLMGMTTFMDTEVVPVACSGGWTADDVYEMSIRYLQTPHCLTIECHFDRLSLELTAHWNVMFGPTTMPTIRGQSLS